MAEALVGGAFLSATLQVLFDRLASPEVVNFFRGRKNVDGLLKKLKLKLPILDAVINEAEDKQNNNPAVKDWLDELKDHVYQADDLLDKIAYEALRCKVEAEHQSGTNQVGDFISTSASLFDAEIESKLEAINDRLEDFSKHKDVLGFREVVRLPSTSLVDEHGVYGRGNDKAEIIKLLFSGKRSGSEVDVIPIVGMGGVGKTTLAQLVYNDDSVNSHFDGKAWVYVSDEFDVFRITKTIFEAITKSTCSIADLNQLQVSLKEKLRWKKFLIVLDDVWNENYAHWDKLKRPFSDGAYGCKIIATTRNQNVASIMQTVPIQNLQQLSDEDCWPLFAKTAFNHGNSNAHPNLKKIGKEIVKRCKGLPLAAKTLGALLRSKVDVDEWNNILKSEIWDLPEDKNEILPVLRLSYHHLPSHLKQCFSYCSIFPKGYIFEKERLVLLWIAQNFVQRPRGNKNIEMVGDEYFDELVSSSFFQRASGYKSSFIMHDLLHDLARVLSGEFSFRSEDKNPHDISKKVRRFSYITGTDDGSEKFKAISEVKCLRTFLPLGHSSCSHYSKVLDTLPTPHCVRVLSMPFYGTLELPHWIGNLIHLRYLDLSCSVITVLPESVCCLYNLQTLLLSNCRFLTTLPADIGKLICLRYLDITRTQITEMPMQFSQLKGLQHLTDFVVGKHSGLGVNGLKEIHLLQGTLSMSNLQNVTSGRDAFEANLEKKLLRELVLRWSGETEDSHNERDVLHNLQPHTNLKRLTISFYGGTTFPGWLGCSSFSNIENLCLYNCKYCFSLPSLGQLPYLKDLTIKGMHGIKKVGFEFYGDASLVKRFQSLERLMFERMVEWEEWSAPAPGGAKEFSRLQKLSVRECPKLTGSLPTDTPSLVNLEIVDCLELMPFPPVQFYPNLRQLIIHNVTNFEILSIPHKDKHPDWIYFFQNWKSLQYVSIEVCPNIVSLAQGDFCAPYLREISVWNCEKLKSLPEQMRELFPALRVFTIDNCPEIESFPEAGLPYDLHHLRIYDCKRLVARRREWGIRSNWSLKNFTISGDYEEGVLDSFPDEDLLPHTLTSLRILSLPNLKALDSRGFESIRYLEELIIWKCPQLQSLPEEGLPASLRRLEIRDCPLLKPRCQSKNGEDWHKIACIPSVIIE